MKKLFFIAALFLGGITVASAQVPKKVETDKRVDQVKKIDQQNDRQQDVKTMKQEEIKNQTPVKKAKRMDMKQEERQTTPVKANQTDDQDVKNVNRRLDEKRTDMTKKDPKNPMKVNQDADVQDDRMDSEDIDG